MKTWDDVVCDLGEDMEISYGKVEELLNFVVYVLKFESKLPKAQVILWLRTAATENYALVKDLFIKAQEGADELKAKRNQIEMDKSMRSISNCLKALTHLMRP